MRDDEGLSQRVRVGLTGLACVFLLVLLAASLFGLVSREAVVPKGQMIDANGAMTANSADPPKEPLAELGVAPGNVPDQSVLENHAAAAPAPRTVPPR